MEYLSRNIEKWQKEDNNYVLQGDFTTEEIRTILDFFEMAPVIRKITVELVDHNFKIFLNEHITGIVSIGLSKEPDTIACFNQPEFHQLMNGVLEFAEEKGYRRLYWNNIPLLVTQEHIKDIQEELEKHPDKKTQKRETKVCRKYFNNIRLH